VIGIVDAFIIGIILIFGVGGLKNGFFKQTVITIGTILLFVVSYYLKDFVADFLSYNLPFFDFGGDMMGLVSLNIIMYQLIGFILVFVVLSVIFGIIVKITGIFEKILKFTIILGIPSKILGFLLGLVEGYVVVFIALFFLHQPIVDVKVLGDSKFMDPILSSSFVLSNVVSDTNDVIDEVYVLVDDYLKDKDVHKFNVKSIDTMLKYKVIDVDYMDKLIEKDKINIPGITMVVDKYR
jgi:uncharacterized membrane protein required for colicin V production